MADDDSAWGQLVSLTDYETAPILLETEKFVIGRALDCDLSLSDNKLVSGRHCYLQKNENGKITLTDTSTNGTLLNMTHKLSKGKSKELEHGDEFYIVFKKENPEANVGYIYQSMEELRKEESTQEYNPPELLDATLEDSDCNYISPVKEKKRKSPGDADNNSPPVKKQKNDNETTDNDKNSQNSIKGEGSSGTCSNKATNSGTKSDKTKTVKEKGKNASENRDKTDGETLDPSKDKSETKELSKAGSGDSKAGSCDSKAGSCDSKAGSCDSKGVEDKSKVSAEPERDDIEENLQCIICQEIMHDCISLQPCLHSFCAGCYSDWMARSNECPSCRKKVERINKNHIVNNLIEAYLKEHPAKKRPEEDIKELNEKNKITNDMLYPKNNYKGDSDSPSSDYSDTDGSDSDSPAPVPTHIPLFQPQPVLYGFGTPMFGATRGFKTVCRQCPDYKDPLAVTLTTDNNKTGILAGVKTAITTVKNLITGADGQTADDGMEPGPSKDNPDTGKGEPGPSTSGETAGSSHREDVKDMPTPPIHVCAANQNHALCQCCLQPMPDFRMQPHLAPDDKRPQSCAICLRSFCHAYWGCKKADCLGCLSKFRDFNFGRKALVGLILENQYESDVFKNYIDSKGLSVKDVLQECCRQLDAGQFTANTAQMTFRFTTECAVCYPCGLRMFKQLALQYRKTIKKEDFPADVRQRPDCYWGSQCRTQRNKPHHAKNFNHICDQTRQF